MTARTFKTIVLGAVLAAECGLVWFIFDALHNHPVLHWL